MTNKEEQKLGEIIRELDKAVGMLIVASTKDKTVKEAKGIIINASFDLDNMI